MSLVFADFGVPQDKRKLGLQHRIYNPELAGGSLLDMGLYSLTWVMQCVYHAQKGRSESPCVGGSLCLDKDTGVDEIATVVLSWKDGIHSRFPLKGVCKLILEISLHSSWFRG